MFLVSHHCDSWLDRARLDWLDIQQSLLSLLDGSRVGDVSWIEGKRHH